MSDTTYTEPSPQAFGNIVERYRKRFALLYTERSTWLYHWQELNDYIYPRRFRYLLFDRNKGTKKNDKIINNTATRAVRTLAAGMMAGLSSPARPWFNLLGPLEWREDQEVKQYLGVVTKLVREALIRSNFYNVVHEMYTTLAVFGTPCMYIEELDREPFFRCYLWPVGQYCLAQNSQEKIDTTYRQFSMTVAQVVKAFGYKRCSRTVQNEYDQGAYDAWVRVMQVIEPNDLGKPQTGIGPNKPWRSVWFEEQANEQQFLRESGYYEFPCVAPRWSLTGEDVYGSCPGMEALGDIKALQLLERRSAQAYDKIVNPPMKGPMSLKTQKISLLPGDVTYVPDSVAGQKLEPAVTVDPRAMQTAQEKIQSHEYRINQTFYTDLFRKLETKDQAPNGGKQPMTATEVNERHEEAMLELGPVIERVEEEGLNPALNRVIQILYRAGKLPPPPEKLSGAKLRVEYVSIMAQAQKILGTASIERFSSFTGSLSAVKPEILDLIDYDRMIRDYAEMLGVPVELLNRDEVVQQLREQRAQAQAQQQAMAQAQQGAEAAKAAAGAQVTPDNLLGRLMGPGTGGASA